MRLMIFGTGYLGKALAEHARDAGAEVFGASLSGSDGAMACDLGEREQVERIARQVGPCDAVVHCASSGRGGAEAYQRVYVDGMKHIAEFFPSAKILYTSSTSVYGQVDGSWVDENSPTDPDRETGRLLLEAERVALAARGVVCRLSGIYGPERSVILRKFLSGEAVIEDDGERYLNQIHRDDAVAAIWHLLEGEHVGLYNVSDDKPLRQRECYEGLAAMFERGMPPNGPRDLNRKRGWTHKRVSNGRLRGSGWHARYGCFLDAALEVAETMQG